MELAKVKGGLENCPAKKVIVRTCRHHQHEEMMDEEGGNGESGNSNNNKRKRNRKGKSKAERKGKATTMNLVEFSQTKLDICSCQEPEN